MTHKPSHAGSLDTAGGPIHIERLTNSYRFDAELATLLTRFQYGEDGITLTAAKSRPLPSVAHDAPTPGLATVFDRQASLVFVCYAERGHRMVNAVELALVSAVTDALATRTPTPDGGTLGPPGEESAVDAERAPAHDDRHTETAENDATVAPSVGVVTPHNAQRGAFETTLAETITANTVEKYQGGERDVIAVSATVSDPEFARHEERFILNPRRLLVAISRSRLLTVVVCSHALFEVAPEDSERLDDGPVWARLFTQAVGRNPEPAWEGPLGEFVPGSVADHTDVPVTVYPSTIDTTGGDQ